MTALSSQQQSRSGERMEDLKWSRQEKAIARQAFDLALGRELEAVMAEVRNRAARIHASSDLWELEEYLTRRRREIDRKYD